MKIRILLWYIVYGIEYMAYRFFKGSARILEIAQDCFHFMVSLSSGTILRGDIDSPLLKLLTSAFDFMTGRKLCYLAE